MAPQFTKENPIWGLGRIQGELATVGYPINDTTVSNILKAHGTEPAPIRKRIESWETFLKSPWDVVAAIDFTTVEVWTKNSLVTYYLLFLMDLKTLHVHCAGCTTSPREAWVKQMRVSSLAGTSYSSSFNQKLNKLASEDANDGVRACTR